MTRQAEIQYVRYYTGGSAAPKVTPAFQEDPFYFTPVPRRKKKRVYVDPFAILGIFTALVMFITMFAGARELKKARAERQAMEEYITTLQLQNAQLQTDYQNSFNLEVVEKTAKALGMVPKEQAENVQINVIAPAEDTVEQEKSVWEKIIDFIQ